MIGSTLRDRLGKADNGLGFDPGGKADALPDLIEGCELGVEVDDPCLKSCADLTGREVSNHTFHGWPGHGDTDLNTDNQFLAWLDLAPVELVECLNFLNCESLEFAGNIPKRVARLHGVCLCT